MADLSVYNRIANIKPLEFNIPKMPTPFERFEDEQKIKSIADKNKLSQVMGKYYQSGGKDNESLYKELAGAGLYEQIPEMQKQQAMAEKASIESEKAKIEMGLKKIDFVAQSVSPWLNKPVTPETQAAWSQFKQQLDQQVGTKLDLPDQFDPQVIAEKHQQGLSVAEQHAQKWKEYESRLSQYKELGVEKRHAESLAETRRGHDIQASNQGWAQTVDPKTGYPMWTHQRHEGTPVYSPTGVANKVLPTGQSKQLIGVKNLSDAADEYVKELGTFDLTDLTSPDAMAGMRTKYNNMMLQAKEAYNLGVLNGPDYQILTDVITDPISMKGVITSNEALKNQALELKRMMGKIGANASVNYTGRAAQQPQQPNEETPTDWTDADEEEYQRAMASAMGGQ